MEVNKTIYTPDNAEYVAIHDEIFPHDSKHIPAVYYKVFDDGDYLGFVSGYLHDSITFYIQRLGLIGVFRNTGRAANIGNAIWEHIKNEGFRFLMGVVETSNIPTIIVALKSGFIIHGFRVDTGGKKYVEIIKEL